MLRIDEHGLTEALARLRRAKERLRDQRPALAVLAEGLRSVIATSFQTGVQADGVAFAPLALSTLAQKKRKGYSAQPLVRRGARGLEGQVAVEVVGQIVRVRVPPSVAYGSFHQLGRGVVARRFLPFNGFPGAHTLMGGAMIARVIEAYRTALRRHVWGP